MAVHQHGKLLKFIYGLCVLQWLIVIVMVFGFSPKKTPWHFALIVLSGVFAWLMGSVAKTFFDLEVLHGEKRKTYDKIENALHGKRDNNMGM